MNKVRKFAMKFSYLPIPYSWILGTLLLRQGREVEEGREAEGKNRMRMREGSYF